MDLYNELIGKAQALFLDDSDLRRLDGDGICSDWPVEEEQRLIFQKETAYELGGSGKPAVSGAAFTTQSDFESGIWLLGADLPDLKADAPYARLTILNVDDSKWKDNEAAFRAMEKMEYTRYHVYPEGFMIRISTSEKREPVRISKGALKRGLNFEKVGKIFADGYRKHPDVRGVKQIFITKEAFPYEQLQNYVRQIESVTSSLHRIFQNPIMDCRACNLKEVCDEVEGLREMHRNLAGSRAY